MGFRRQGEKGEGLKFKSVVRKSYQGRKYSMGNIVSNMAMTMWSATR